MIKMIRKFYDERREHERREIDRHLAGCHVLAVPTTISQEKMYEYALGPLLEEGKIRGYLITRDSTEAFYGMFDPEIEGDLVTVIHQTSDLVNEKEAARRKALLIIAKSAKGVHPILVDPKAHEYVDIKNGIHYAIRDGVPSFPPTSETMIPCEEHMHRLLALSGHHLLDETGAAG